MANRRLTTRPPRRANPMPRTNNPYRLSGQRQALPPALHAALIFIIPLLVIQLLNAFFIHAVFWWLYPVHLIIYFLNGYMAGRFYYDSIYHKSHQRAGEECVKAGAAAGLTLSLVSWVILAVLIFGLGLVTLGFVWTDAVSVVLCGPADVIVAMLIGALGGWWLDKTW